MANSLDDRTHDHEVLMHIIVELAQAAAAAGDMTEVVVEQVVEIERLLEIALRVTHPDG